MGAHADVAAQLRSRNDFNNHDELAALLSDTVGRAPRTLLQFVQNYYRRGGVVTAADRKAEAILTLGLMDPLDGTPYSPMDHGKGLLVAQNEQTRREAVTRLGWV